MNIPPKHNSSSEFQANREVEIIEKFIKKFYTHSVELNSEKIFTLDHSSKIKMQFDLYLKENNAIGEVYVTELPFNSGRKRKFQSDILKMITFEKKIGEKFNKYYILTSDEEKLKSIHSNVVVGEFYEHTREKSLIGKDTWLNLTLHSFNIRLYYYCLDQLTFEILKKTRANQKKGITQ